MGGQITTPCIKKESSYYRRYSYRLILVCFESTNKERTKKILDSVTILKFTIDTKLKFLVSLLSHTLLQFHVKAYHQIEDNLKFASVKLSIAKYKQNKF